MSCSSGCSPTSFIPDNIMDKINNHPCYSEGAHHHYARIHLPVAPACNIQCNYCNRKYDCSNESRPGVTSEKLNPQEGLKKVLYVGAEVHRLSVVGIAGPGDALANPKKTFETFELLKQHTPDLKLCLSTNGLALSEHLDRIIELGVDHVTVTINTVNPEIGAKIYPWIYDTQTKKRYTGVEAATILLERQLDGIKKCAEKGILVKANSVLIPGVNENDLANVSKKLKELGVFLHNIMPILSEPEFGTYFALNGVPSATDEQLFAAQQACGMDMNLMKHCRQCRADAVGMIGEDRGAEFTKEIFVNSSIEELVAKYDLASRGESQAKIEAFRQILDEANARVASEKRALSSTGETILVAITSMGEGMINQHFGAVKEFMIYEAGDLGTRFLTHRKVAAEYCQGPDSCANPMEEIASKLHDCKLLLTAKIGECPMKTLNELGVIVDQSHAFEPIEASILTATRKLFAVPLEEG